MPRFLSVLFVAIFAVSSLHVSPIYAKGGKKPEKEIKGTVSVTKDKDGKVSAIEITGDDKTVYEVKVDAKSEKMAKDYEGKSVTVKGKVTVVSGKKTISLDKVVDDNAKPKSKSTK